MNKTNRKWRKQEESFVFSFFLKYCNRVRNKKCSFSIKRSTNFLLYFTKPFKERLYSSILRITFSLSYSNFGSWKEVLKEKNRFFLSVFLSFFFILCLFIKDFWFELKEEGEEKKKEKKKNSSIKEANRKTITI